MLQKIKYFLKASETGSFSVAAREMYISPPALTKQIKLLEDELGGKLFVRTTQGVTLTGLGQFASKKLSVVSQEMDDALDEIREYAQDSKIRIKMGVFSALPLDDLVSPVVSFLLVNYPQYQIGYELLEMDEGLKMLRAGKLDMLMSRVHEQEALEGFQCYSFGEQPSKVIVSLAHPWVMKDHITQEDMRKETFYNFPVDSLNRDTAQNDFYRQVPCRNIRIVSNYSTIKMLLHQGEGFAVLPMDKDEVGRSHLKSFDYPGKTLHYHTALIYRKNNSISGIEEIAEELAEEFELTTR